MRLVQISVPPGTRELVLETLDTEEVDYFVSDETGGSKYTAIVSFSLPDNAVEPILDALREGGLGDDAHIIIVDAETVISEDFNDLQDRFESEDVTEERISRQELQTRAAELTPAFSIYVALTLISAIVATAGLLLDSAAVVVGSMVIAPLIGPALSASVGTVVNEPDLFDEGFTYQIIGVVVAIAGSAVFAWVAKTAFFVPPGIEIGEIGEISERLTPDILSLFVALGAGVAGVLSLSTGVSVALVGVMIAAALIPPAAAAGIAIAWGLPMAAVGSVVLVFVNLVSINLAGLLTLWYTGYRPENLFETSAARRQVLRQVGAYAIAVLLLSSFLVGATVTSFQHASFENAVVEETEGVLAQAEYEGVELLEHEIVFDDSFPFEQPERVILTVGHPAGEQYPHLTAALREAIVERTDADVAVQVRFVEYEERR